MEGIVLREVEVPGCTPFYERQEKPDSGGFLPVSLNPFTPKSDHCQISPAASPELLHHTVWRTWLFIAYWDER